MSAKLCIVRGTVLSPISYHRFLSGHYASFAKDCRTLHVMPLKLEYKKWCSLVGAPIDNDLVYVAAKVLVQVSANAHVSSPLPAKLGIRGVGGNDSTINIDVLESMDVQTLAQEYRRQISGMLALGGACNSTMTFIADDSVSACLLRIAQVFENVWRVSDAVLRKGKCPV